MFEWKKFFVDVCEKLHAFRSPLLELATSGAGDLMKNIKQIHFCGPGKLFLVSFITLGWVKKLLYTLAFHSPKWYGLKTLLTTVESKWKTSFAIPMVLTCITCLGLEFGT